MAKSKYDINTFPILAEGYAREGMIDTEIAAKLGISHDTYYKYQKKYPEFSDAIKRGKAPVDIEVEKALLKRALGYEFEETHKTMEIKEGQPHIKEVKTVKKHFQPDVGACAFWLKNRKPEKWTEKQIVENRGNPMVEAALKSIKETNGTDKD